MFSYFKGKWPAAGKCNIEKVLSYFATDSQSVLALSPSVTPDQILAVVRQLWDWCHGVSSLMGGCVCLLYLTLYWSLLHLTLSGVFFTWTSTGVFFTWHSLESSLFELLLESSLLDPLLKSSSLNTLLSLLYLTLYWSLLVWVWFWVTCNWQSVSHSVCLSWPWVPPSLCPCVGCLEQWYQLTDVIRQTISNESWLQTIHLITEWSNLL